MDYVFCCHISQHELILLFLFFFDGRAYTDPVVVLGFFEIQLRACCCQLAHLFVWLYATIMNACECLQQG